MHVLACSAWDCAAALSASQCCELGKRLLSAIVKGNAGAVAEPSERMALDGSDALNDGRQCPRGLNMSKRVGFLPAPFAGGNPQPHWIVNFP